MDLEQQLHAALAPREPGPAPLAAVMAQLSRASPPRRTFSRSFLFGTLFAVATAAAAVLGLQMTRTQVSQPAGVAATAPPAFTSPPAVTTSVMETPLPSASTAAVPMAAVKPVAPQASASARPFTLQVMPLQNDSTDAAGKAAVDAFHAALLDGLRTVPGLILDVVDASQPIDAASAEYRLTIRGAGPVPGNRFTIYMQAAKVPGFVMPIQLSGDIAPACAGTGATGCGDPASMAATFLQLLRDRVFPPDPSFADQMQARFLDSRLTVAARLDALTNLQMWKSSANSPGNSPATRNPLHEPTVIRGVIDLVATSTEPAVRAGIWRTMQGVGSPELIQPLVASLRQDPDGGVRVEAATTLVADFAADPRVRAALEAAADADSLPMVRALAERGTRGEVAWNGYVAASLKDASLSDAERIEPLFHTLNQPGPRPDLRALLAEEQAITALAQVLPRAVKSLPKGEMSMIVLLGGLSSINHPAITDMLLDSLATSRELSVRQQIVQQLARRSAEPRVRAVLEKTSSGDADPRLRDIAASALKTSAPTTAP
jgi:HEAT repeat protein